jgi:hypothetical protein
MPQRQTPLRSLFAICIKADEDDDLRPRTIYQVLSDANAARDGYLRIIDESGEDYLYPADQFILIKLLKADARRIATISKSRAA